MINIKITSLQLTITYQILYLKAMPNVKIKTMTKNNISLFKKKAN
jgi:hypothetical protein